MPEDLITRLEAAERGSRELDALIWCWEHDCDFIKIADGTEAYGDLTLQGERGHGWPNKVTKGALVFRHRTPQERGNLTQCWGSWPPPSASYTSSLDAILALVERKLPGVWFVLARGKTRATEPLHGARLLFGSDQIIAEAEHEELPLALCIALLKALKAQGDAHG